MFCSLPKVKHLCLLVLHEGNFRVFQNNMIAIKCQSLLHDNWVIFFLLTEQTSKQITRDKGRNVTNISSTKIRQYLFFPGTVRKHKIYSLNYWDGRNGNIDIQHDFNSSPPGIYFINNYPDLASSTR